MTKRKTLELAAGLMLWVVIIGVIQHYRTAAHEPVKNATLNSPCNDSRRCILVITPDGVRYELNDFRFLQNHCIVIFSLPEKVERQICGDYKLDWIGPTTNTMKGKQL